MYVTSYVWQINRATYDGASAAQRAVIDRHCTPEWAEKLASAWADYEAAGRELTRKAPGHTVTTLTAEQLARWKAAAAPLQQSWEDSVRKAGQDPVAVLGELRAKLIEQHAAAE